MDRRILRMLINGIVFFSFTTTAWAAPSWWKASNETQPSNDNSSATVAPKVPEKTQYKEFTHNTAALKLGGYLPQASDVEEFDNSFYGELEFGHHFNNYIAIELGVGYTKPRASVSFFDGFTTTSVDVELNIVPITLGLRGSMPMGAFEPFAIAGIGAYYTRFEASVSATGIGSASGSENDTAIGYFLGLGANFNVSPNAYIGLEGKYFWAEPSFEGEDLKIDGINLTANIGCRF